MYSSYHREPSRANTEVRRHEVRELTEPIDRRHHYQHRKSSIKREQFTRSLSNTEPSTDEKAGKLLFLVDGQGHTLFYEGVTAVSVLILLSLTKNVLDFALRMVIH